MASLDYPALMRLSPPSRPISASVRLPGSKSITNRALLIAALAEGTSTLRDPLHSEDTFYMADALRSLGAEITQAPNKDYVVRGVAGASRVQDRLL